MLTNKIKIASLTVCAVLAVVACKKELKYIAETSSPENKAFIKLVHAAPSFGKLFNAKDSFNVYANDQKINATFLTYGSAFPSATGNGYLAIDPGTINVKLFVAGVVKPDSIEITSMTKTVEANKYYSLIVTDSIKSPRDSSQIALMDEFESTPPNLYGLRFVHAVMNDSAGKKIDIYSARRNGNIITGFSPGQSSSFTNYPYNGQVPDTLIVRRAGTSFELARLATITFGHQRIYTLYYRGHADSLPAARRASRTLTYYVNK